MCQQIIQEARCSDSDCRRPMGIIESDVERCEQAIRHDSDGACNEGIVRQNGKDFEGELCVQCLNKIEQDAVDRDDHQVNYKW
ncbi:hypothetical protein PG993_000571 [Apiospora rasikravindrae]|uniref:Uncharacterized protein n=1 Tax=Apiospora rasikravindrae TaxID=990691 RepID=A0ABR1U8Z5_9PEZI